MDAFTITVAFEKATDAGRYVSGWAAVSTVDGVPVADWENDTKTIDELRKAAHKYVTEARVAKAMHKGSQIGDIVESVIVDDDFAKALGATTNRRGWWIKMDVADPEIRKGVREGVYKGFSIGGRGVRKDYEGAACRAA